MRRGYVFIPVSIILICTIFSGGCSRRPTRGLMQEPVAAPPAAVEQGGQEESFGTTLTRHLSLPPEQQEDLHAKAVAHLKDVRKFQWESYQARDSKLRYHFYQGVYIDRDTWGVGLGNSIHDLQQACKLDPSYAEAWGLLGHFYASAGDPYKGRESLDRARLAIIARNQTDRPVDREVQLEIFRNRAWVLRDLGLWEEGLDAVQEGLRFRRGDRDLVLLKGLCLAGAGRYEDAVSLAVRMKPFEYPKFDLFHIGSSQQTSDYANRWIKSQAALAVGDYAQARHVLGGLESYPYRWYMPHQNRFFRDVGLAAELVDDPEAATYYAIALISDPYYGFFPYMAGNLLPLVQDVPDPYLPYFTSFGGRFYLGGSLLSYAARQMNMMSLSVFEMQRSQAAWRALQALNIAERRNIRPDVVRALRGRVYFSQDELALARQDLTAASEAFRKEGRPDAGTSLLMGLLEMNEGRYQEAVPQLQEAVLTDPELAVGWRSLGVSLARLNRADQAAQAMDQALELEPRSVSGLYNRGLLHLQNQDFVRAGACLERAYQLDPENHEVQRLLRTWLPSVGFHEIVTTTFMTRAELEALGLPEGDVRGDSLKVLNAHHGRELLLRTSLVPSFVDTARRNLNSGAAAPVRLFQLGHVFLPSGTKPAEVRHEKERLLPQEPWLLQIGLAGGGLDDGMGGVPGDIEELKGLLGGVAGLLRVPLALEPGGDQPFLSPAVQWTIRDGEGRAVGWAGRLAPAVAEALELDHDAAILELDLGGADLTAAEVSYAAFSRYPAVKRDLSLLVPSHVTYEQVQAVATQAGGELVESLELFDIYKGKGVEDGHAAYGIRLKFRSAKANLKGKTVDGALQRITGALSDELGVRQRV